MCNTFAPVSLSRENSTIMQNCKMQDLKIKYTLTGKIDNYKPFKFLLKFALWHDFLVYFSFCLKVR